MADFHVWTVLARGSCHLLAFFMVRISICVSRPDCSGQFQVPRTFSFQLLVRFWKRWPYLHMWVLAYRTIGLALSTLLKYLHNVTIIFSVSYPCLGSPFDWVYGPSRLKSHLNPPQKLIFPVRILDLISLHVYQLSEGVRRPKSLKLPEFFREPVEFTAILQLFLCRYLIATGINGQKVIHSLFWHHCSFLNRL